MSHPGSVLRDTGRVTTARDRPPEEAAIDTSFARGLRLLLTVADRGEVRADDLAVILEMPVSTVYRYLRTLGEFGFVDKRGGSYALGPRLVIGGGSTVTSERLIRYADPVLRMLVEETGETALLVRRVGLSAVCLLQVESEQALRVSIPAGSVMPLHTDAAGRTLLAHAPEELLDEVIAQDLLTADDETVAELRDALSGIVDAGVATSGDEDADGLVSMAVPIMREDGIVGAIVVTGPAQRCGLAWRTHTRRALLAGAKAVSGTIDEEVRL
jgi:DNA-binding IclR family transcriptional regulator